MVTLSISHSTLEEVINTLTSKQKSLRQAWKNVRVNLQWWIKNAFSFGIKY